MRDPLVLLAAGRSERMREPKGLLPVGGVPFLLWQLRRYAEAGGSRAFVVTAPDPEPYGVLLADGERVVNPDPHLGPFSSLQVGLKAMQALHAGGAFVLPLDVPAPLPTVWRDLLAARAPMAAIPLTPFCRGGHPVWISAAFAAHLIALDPFAPEARLDRQIRALPADAVVRVPVASEDTALNLNDPAAWRQWVDAPGLHD